MKKLQRNSLAMLIALLLMTISTNLIASERSSTSNLRLGDSKPPVPLSLSLVDPIEIEQDGKILFAWDTKGYGTIIQFQTAYNLWADNYTLRLEKKELSELRLNICHERVAKHEEISNDLRLDREYAYDAVDAQHNHQKKEARKATIKGILIGTGSGLGGLAIGLIVGFIAASK